MRSGEAGGSATFELNVCTNVQQSQLLGGVEEPLGVQEGKGCHMHAQPLVLCPKVPEVQW